MARDVNVDIEALKDELASLKASLSKQAGDALDEAANTVSPKARRVAAQLKQEGAAISEVARENPAAASGVVFGALALGAFIGWCLASGSGRGRY